jgi:hypothetical protein
VAAANNKKTLFAAGLDIRYVGSVSGRYTFTTAAEPAVYACRTVSLSPGSIVLQGPVAGAVGDRVAMRLEHIGLLNGSVSQLLSGAFHVTLIAGEAEKRRIAARINWLKKHALKQADDKRSGVRFQPRNPRGHLTVESAEHECFIIDMSATGAALSARLTPPLRTPVVIGNVPGIVIRHFEGGFGVTFDKPYPPDGVEAEITAPHVPAEAS